MTTPNYQTTVKNDPLSILAACAVEELEQTARTLLEFAEAAEIEQAAQTLLEFAEAARTLLTMKR